MPRHLEAPRLWLRPERSRGPSKTATPATWIILDNGRQSSTLCRESEIDKANALLFDYVARHYPDGAPTSEADLIRVPRPRSSVGVLYFVDMPELSDSPIKIGYSSTHRLTARLMQLQIGSPFKIGTIGVCEGTREDEHRLHREFRECRIRGEWFRRTSELTERISGLCASAEPPTGRQRNP